MKLAMSTGRCHANGHHPLICIKVKKSNTLRHHKITIHSQLTEVKVDFAWADFLLSRMGINKTGKLRVLGARLENSAIWTCSKPNGTHFVKVL